jgi:hypothetical protein
MARTDATEVGYIIEVDDSIDLTSFINVANNLVTQFCTGLDDDYTDDELKNIETWLTAHFYRMRDQNVIEERAGDISAKYQGKIDLGLNGSHYGQQAMLLDYRGGLAGLNDKITKGKVKTPTIGWLGKEEDES